jgi:hypothetical protein
LLLNTPQIERGCRNIFNYYRDRIKMVYDAKKKGQRISPLPHEEEKQNLLILSVLPMRYGICLKTFKRFCQIFVNSNQAPLWRVWDPSIDANMWTGTDKIGKARNGGSNIAATAAKFARALIQRIMKKRKIGGRYKI